MTGILYVLGRFCVRHRWLVISVWLVALIGIGGWAKVAGDNSTDDYTLPGTGAQLAADVLDRLFPEQANGSSQVVFHSANGPMNEGGAYEEALSAAFEALKNDPMVQEAVNPLGKVGDVIGLVSDDGTTAYIPVILNEPPGQVMIPEAEALVETARQPTEGLDIQVAAGGVIGEVLAQPEPGGSEQLSTFVALLILAVVFGSLFAAGVPIVTAMFALGIGLSSITLISHVMDIPTVAPTIALMIGLGVGIDYALFSVTRHRDQLREGMEMRESVARSTATSGGAIVFAGTTVMIAIASLGLAGIPMVARMGYMTAIVVGVAVLAAITLLPAMLSGLGRAINWVKLPRFLRIPQGDPAESVWARWADWVGRHPWTSVAAALAILIPLTLPLLRLELGSPDTEAQPEGDISRTAYVLMEEGFGPGYNGQLLIAVELDEPATAGQALLDDIAEGKDMRATAMERKRAVTQRFKDRGHDLKDSGLQLAADGAPLLARQQQLEAAGARLLQRKDALLARGAELQRKGQQLKAAGARLKAKGERLGGQLQGVASTIAEVQAELASTSDPAEQARLTARLQRLSSRADALQTKLAQVQQQGESLAAQGERLAAQGEKLKADGEALAADGAALQAEGTQLAADGKPLLERKKDLERAASDLKRDVRHMKAKAKRLKHGTRAENGRELKREIISQMKAAGGKRVGTDPRLVALQQAFEAQGGVVDVSPVQVSDNGRAAVVTVTPTTAPNDPATAELVARFRNAVIPQAIQTDGTKAYVGGFTAAYEDLAEKITGVLPWVIGSVIAASFLLLMLAFRSIAIPIKAAIMNVLSVAAAYGVLVAVFQWGWGLDLIGVSQVDKVPIVSFVPLMMFAVLFGLSMDYEVFLMSQIVEHHRTGETNHDSVVHGLATSARVITAAALIMVTVFGLFIIEDNPIIKQFGIGLSVAVALDATVIRILLVPASMTLLGEANWWLPRWLDRILPRLDLEGKAYFLSRDKAAADAAMAAAERDLPVPE